MPNKNWVTHSLENLSRKEEEKKELIRFWNEFYNSLLQYTNMSGQQGKTKSVQYKEEVFDILHKSKASLSLTEAELRNIQMEIEDLTILFDEKSMFKTAPNIIRILIRNNDESARDYLRGRVLEKDNIELLSEFGQSIGIPGDF